MYIYKKKHNGYISNQTALKSGIYLQDFYYYYISHHVAGFVFMLPKSNHLQNLLTPKDNLLNETTPETIICLLQMFLNFLKRRL